mmetsp:Transcript_57621/g.137009  ORF Transcript_57621/g.137009 Transcript_57621/m.137009 type:complete len:114 (+) Transcript_57621:171-512(+)
MDDAAGVRMNACLSKAERHSMLLLIRISFKLCTCQLLTPQLHIPDSQRRKAVELWLSQPEYVSLPSGPCRAYRYSLVAEVSAPFFAFFSTSSKNLLSSPVLRMRSIIASASSN